MTTELTKQVITILAEIEKPVLLASIFRMQTVTKHEARLGLLLRDLEDKNLVISIFTVANYKTHYKITPSGVEFYKKEVMVI